MAGLVNFAKVQGEIKRVFIDALGGDVSHAFWRHESTEDQRRPFGELAIQRMRTLGVDEQRQLQDLAEVGEEITWMTVGNRQMTVEFRMTSRDQRPNGSAWGPMEDAKAGLRQPWAATRFRAAGVAVASLGDTVPFQHKHDGRKESIVVFEGVFNVTACVLDERSAATYIEHAEVTSLISDADGLIPAELQLDAELMPPATP